MSVTKEEAVAARDSQTPARGTVWKWWVCGLLLLATMINYMDRQTLSLTALRIMADFDFDVIGYGRIESAFAIAFAVGAIIFGFMVDRWNVRWIYPAAVLAWSAAGCATGLAQGYFGLLCFRFLLGLAEASNWPCALRTTQRILPPSERAMGNGILQSGASIGAILTPLVVLPFVQLSGTWRYPFLAIGIVGMSWVFLWLASIRREDLALPVYTGQPSGTPSGATTAALRHEDAPLGIWLDRRFWILVLLVVTINISWHFFRAWLPLFLQEQHGYSEEDTALFISAYYVVTDLGALTAGFVTLYLARRGLAVHRSRVLVFVVCALLTALSVATAQLSTGPVLLGVLLVVGFGAMGLFPIYYSFSQELTVRHQGKVTGTLGCICWIAMALLHDRVGDSIKSTGSYSQAMALAGLAPLLGVLALVFFWGKEQEPQELASVLEK